MFHACVQKFNVMENLKNLTKFSATKLDLNSAQPAIVHLPKINKGYDQAVKPLTAQEEPNIESVRWLVSGLIWAGRCWFIVREKHC